MLLCITLPPGIKSMCQLQRFGHDTRLQILILCVLDLPFINRQAAVDATTRNLALEWGTDYDIRVNGIAPGPIGDTTGMSKLAPDEITSKARESMPLYKLGEKWDIAMAALYLASDAGSLRNFVYFQLFLHLEQKL